jgi:hypothetical protein
MGMLAAAAQKKESDSEAKKPDPKHKKKHAKPSPEVASNQPGATPGATEPGSSGPDAEPESDADADSSGDQSTPDASQDNGPADGEAQGGATPASPQDPQNQGGDSPQPQEEQSDVPGGDAGQGEGQDAGGQGATPPEGATDDSAGGQAGQGGSQNQVDLSKVPISPALKEEFMRCNAALHTALYTNDQVAQHVINGIVPDGPHKVESVAKMAVLLVVQINKQLNFIKDTPAVTMPFTQDVVEEILQLVTQVKKIQFSQQEAHAALGTAQELILRTVGVTKKQMKGLQGALPRSQIMDGMDKYKQHLDFIKGVQGPNSPNQTPPAGGAQPQSPAPAQAGAGGPSPAGQPQPGAPVTAAPGPGQSAPPGGMLTAAQAPGGQ